MSRQSWSPWYADSVAWRLIGLRYLPWLAGLNLAWEIAQLPLYALWSEGSAGYIAYSVMHCTLGDAAIGATALVAVLLVTRAPHSGHWRWGRIALLTALFGTLYTGFSEWVNTVLRHAWTYSEWMPVVRAFGVDVGLSPIAQWLILPPLAFRLALMRAGASGERS